MGRARGVPRLSTPRSTRSSRPRWRRPRTEALGVAPDASGLVDHEPDRRRLGARPRATTRSSTPSSTSSAPEPPTAPPRVRPAVTRGSTPEHRTFGSSRQGRCLGGSKWTSIVLAADGGEGEVGPRSRRRRGATGRSSSANQPTSPRTRAGGAAARRPSARQWNTSKYSGMRVKPRRSPSSTARRRTRLALDAGLLAHLLHHDLGRRVADVGPAGRVEPDARVGPLHEQDLALVVADDRADRHLRGDVAGDALADLAHPLARRRRRRRGRSPAATRMSAATASTSSKRSCS